ncbi:MAG: hypothetical protein D6E12_03550 [Desulfovibrio sp.]|nr:MAG: hypothetical protein D6E12_03550 [Desulfovibrio sp.]
MNTVETLQAEQGAFTERLVVRADSNNGRNSFANEMKQIRKARLQRQVMQDPSLARKLVSVEASPLYNASGDLIQAVSGGSVQV